MVNWINKSSKSLNKIQHRTKTGQLASLSFSSGDRRNGGRKTGRKKWKGTHKKVQLLLKTIVTDVQMRIWLQYSNCSYKQDHLLSYMEIQTFFHFYTFWFFIFPFFGKQTKTCWIKLFEQQNNNSQVPYISIRKVFSNCQH